MRVATLNGGVAALVSKPVDPRADYVVMNGVFCYNADVSYEAMLDCWRGLLVCRREIGARLQRDVCRRAAGGAPMSSICRSASWAPCGKPAEAACRIRQRLLEYTRRLSGGGRSIELSISLRERTGTHWLSGSA
jgi:hypothetical protein